jgi:hypothetical protein
MADGMDPRYAAQFQRGYDPSVHPPVRERRGPAPIQAPTPPVVHRVTDAPSADPRPREAEPPAVVVDVVSDDPVPVARSRSEWALLVVGVVLLAVAGWLFAKSVEFANLYSGVGPELDDQILSMASNTLPGPLLLAGFVALCLWVVLQAVRPRR